MRYYKIEIDGGKTYTSFENGRTNPAALLVEWDIPVWAFDTPAGSAFVRIWGVPLADIGQAADLNFKGIKVYGGFQKGLPLARPEQSGLLVQGYIFQAFGNWIGTSMSLDLYIMAGPSPATRDAPKNLVLNWKKGASMKDAINTAITTAYPGYTANININDKLVTQNENENGFYETLTQFSQYLKETSKAIIGGTTYQGITVTMSEKTINVFDGSAAASSSSGGSKVVAFNDLIGQPTWIESPSIQFKTAMRADFKIGDQINMPPSLVTNSARAATSLVNQRAAFQGKFQIATMRHVGNSRQPDAGSWVSVFNAFPLTTSSAK